MTRSTELAPKKKDNCNVVVTWPRHVISLVIPSNNILLSPPIALTYYLDGSLFQYTKSYSSIVGSRLPISHCWEAHQPLSHLLRSLPAAILFVGKRSLYHLYCHPTIFPFVGKRPSLIWFCWGFISPLIALRLRANDLVIIQINFS